MSCVRGCCEFQADHYRSVALFGPSPQRDAARKDEADMHAYKRLVQSGVQPKAIDGAAELERGASTAHEVEHATIITDPRKRRAVTQAFKDVAQASATSPDAA